MHQTLQPLLCNLKQVDFDYGAVESQAVRDYLAKWGLDLKAPGSRAAGPAGLAGFSGAPRLSPTELRDQVGHEGAECVCVGVFGWSLPRITRTLRWYI